MDVGWAGDMVPLIVEHFPEIMKMLRNELDFGMYSSLEINYKALEMSYWVFELDYGWREHGYSLVEGLFGFEV